VLRTDCDLKDQLDDAKDVVGLGFVLLLICLVTYALLSVPMWVVLGLSLIGAVSIVDGVRRYIKCTRGVKK
jgi:hypothetical protein